MLSSYYGVRTRKGGSTYAEIGGPDGYLANAEVFAGNSLNAAWEHRTALGLVLEGEGVGRVYVVRSYATAIAVFDPATGEVTLNEAKYSATTSRHQGLVRTWLAVNRPERERLLAGAAA